MKIQKTSLDMFIPEDRRQALTRGETLPDRSYGAVIFADLSGYTKITEALSIQLGPQRGAEELTHRMEQIYTGLVAEIHNYRGSVIGISGDGTDSHRSFSDRWHLPYSLLSDTEGTGRHAFRVHRTLGLFPGRVTYVIDREGIIRAAVNDPLSASRHVREALDALKAHSTS